MLYSFDSITQANKQALNQTVRIYAQANGSCSQLSILCSDCADFNAQAKTLEKRSYQKSEKASLESDCAHMRAQSDLSLHFFQLIIPTGIVYWTQIKWDYGQTARIITLIEVRII